MSILVFGGAGFIGTNFVKVWMENSKEEIIVFDKLTYASNFKQVQNFEKNEKYFFCKGDIKNRTQVSKILKKYKPRKVINFAAESHVDNSINSPFPFVDTNIIGTLNLLETIKNYFENIEKSKRNSFCFLNVSTDEVFGSLEKNESSFEEHSPYKPNSPYSASKAGADHLVRSFFVTYGLPVITSNCSNNYGPFQHSEKLIPHVIKNALLKNPIPVYGNGQNIRDWLYVTDHCDAIIEIVENGKIGSTYNIGGNQEMANIEIVKKICLLLDKKKPNQELKYSELIRFVKDRPGHDKRYSVNSNKIKKELNWKSSIRFDDGISKTVTWYLNNQKDLFNLENGKS